MSNLVILKWHHFENKGKFEKKWLFLVGPKKVFLTYFLNNGAKETLKI